MLFFGHNRHCSLVLFETYFSCAKVNEEKLFTINYSFNKRNICIWFYIYFFVFNPNTHILQANYLMKDSSTSSPHFAFINKHGNTRIIIQVWTAAANSKPKKLKATKRKTPTTPIYPYLFHIFLLKTILELVFECVHTHTHKLKI